MKKTNIQSDIDSRKAIEYHGTATITFLEKVEAVEPIKEIVEPIKEIENGNSEEIQGGTDNQAGSRSEKSKAKRRKTERNT